MAIKYMDPEEMIHPLRKTMSDDELGDIANGVANNEDWMSLDEIEAVADLLFDHIAASKQTHLGVVTLQ